PPGARGRRTRGYGTRPSPRTLDSPPEAPRMAKVIIAGGGTGGHIYPGLAVAEELRRRHPDWDISFVGTLRGLESRVLPETGFHLHLINVVGLPRKPGP